MACNINLQRNSKVFYSTVDIAGGAVVTAMVPANTWRVEVLAGYATSQSAATQEITASESGTNPDRTITSFNTAINPVDWNLQAYLRPTGIDDTEVEGDTISATSNSKPVADWFLWQAMFSNIAPATGSAESSAWQNGGGFDVVERVTSSNVSATKTNISVVQENYLYVIMDNIFYQVSNAAINEASVDASIDGIATTTWTGFGTNLIELTGTKRNNAVAVFGGTLNDGTSATGNSNAHAISAASSYHPWSSYNVAGAITTSSFIKNRLSTIDMYYTPDGGAATNYTFPVTSLTWSFNNNMTYLTPEELSALNSPIGNFSGSRGITASLSAYLRHGNNETAEFLRNIITDTRTTHATSANANLIVGGATAPYVAFYMPATQFQFPSHNIEDVISIQINLNAEETEENCGLGGEVEVLAKKS